MTHSVIKATDIYRDYVTKATMFKKGDVVHALKGVSFELKKKAKRLRLWVKVAAASPRWRGF